ncbi:MAG: flagellar filament capping protein FliD [Lachnospiraceae bacterium]|nr:flagellar filament capping protein FliD [Lachnospiraceae bacterium]
MAINISAKTDYSALFSSLPTSRSGDAMTNMSWLSDYASVKNGSYGKLMKAYYAADPAGAEKTSDSKTAKSSSDVLSSITSHTAAAVDQKTNAYSKVKAAADAVQKAVTGGAEADPEDADKRKAAVSSYVKAYNNLLETTSAVDHSSIANRMTNLKATTAGASSDLAKVGITVSKDGKLSLDEEKLAAADEKDIKKLFEGKGSYGYSATVSAAMVESNANYAASSNSTYNAAGDYSNFAGSLFTGTV